MGEISENDDYGKELVADLRSQLAESKETFMEMYSANLELVSTNHYAATQVTELRTQIVLLQAERDGILSELLSLQRECIDANKKIRYLENEKGERNEPSY